MDWYALAAQYATSYLGGDGTGQGGGGGYAGPGNIDFGGHSTGAPTVGITGDSSAVPPTSKRENYLIYGLMFFGAVYLVKVMK